MRACVCVCMCMCMSLFECGLITCMRSACSPTSTPHWRTALRGVACGPRKETTDGVTAPPSALPRMVALPPRTAATWLGLGLGLGPPPPARSKAVAVAT